MKRLLPLIVLCIVGGPLWATDYATVLLQQMAQAMQLDARLQALPNGTHWRTLQHQGQPLVVVKQQGRVQHIGIALFTPHQRQLLRQQAIADFLERYILELSLPLQRPQSVAAKMVEDHVDVLQGSLAALTATVSTDTTCSFSTENRFGRQMLVKWARGEHTVCELTFPLDFELLSGTTMQERERRLMADLRHVGATMPDVLPTSTKGLRRSLATGHYVLPGESLYTPQLSTARYYREDSQGRLQLLQDERFPLESMANLVTSTELGQHVSVSVALDVYGLRQEYFTVPLAWLNSYMVRQGCKQFFGLMNFDGQKATCEVVSQNETLGYHHVMKIEAATSLTATAQGTATARLTAYLPTSRLMYLFDELKK